MSHWLFGRAACCGILRHIFIFNFDKVFGARKLELLLWRCLVILRLAVLVELRLVTDGRTNRQTDKYTASAYRRQHSVAQ